MSTEIATREQAMAVRYELEVDDVIAQVQKIQAVMAKVMHEGEHFGVIPGTKKPTLLKPGAEKLCLTFRLDPQYTSAESYDGKHLTVVTTCTLWHITTGQRMGSGMGSCSTKESKYAYRDRKRHCPACSNETIIRGKAEYGGGWLCFAKRGGCGAKYNDGDAAIEGQTIGRVANEDLADAYNTVLKMANKRALVAAVLNVTAASDLFTQDLEDTPPVAVVVGRAEVTPPSVVQEPDPEPDREAMIEEIRKRSKNVPAPDKAAAAETYLGGAQRLEDADSAALSDLLGWLRARQGS